MLGLRLRVVLRSCVRINPRIRVRKLGVTNGTHCLVYCAFSNTHLMFVSADHYSDVTFVMVSQITGNITLFQQFLLANIKKLHITGLFKGDLYVTGGFPHKGPVMWKAFPCENIVMWTQNQSSYNRNAFTICTAGSWRRPSKYSWNTKLDQTPRTPFTNMD